MKKSTCILIYALFILVACLQCKEPVGGEKNLDRPSNVPQKARLISDLWVLDLENKDGGVFASWDESGKLLSLQYVNSKLLFSVGFGLSGKLVEIHQECHPSKVQFKHLQDGNLQIKMPDKSLARYYGRFYQFDAEGNLIREACANPVQTENDTQKMLDEEALIGLEEERLCGTEVFFGPDGNIRETRDHPPCRETCGRFIPSMKVGKYKILKQAKVRKAPSLNGELLFLANAGDEVEVLEDTGLLQTVDSFTAPWVKIRTSNNKEGFLFGGLLKLPYYPVDDRDVLKLLNRKLLDREVKCP